MFYSMRANASASDDPSSLLSQLFPGLYVQSLTNSSRVCINVPVDHSKIHKVLISPVGLFTDMLFVALTVNKNVLLQIWAHSSLHKPTTPN